MYVASSSVSGPNNPNTNRGAAAPQKGNTMPLNWNAESVKDWDDLPDYKYSVIDYTMSIGIGQIKKDNVRKWCDRARFMRLVHGPMLWIDKEHRDDGKDYHPLEDREFIGKLVGLRTNASNVPQNKWLKWMYEGKVSDWAWQRRNKCSGE